MSWEKMSTRSKLCIGCAVCSAAIFVVMVPIGVFVIRFTGLTMRNELTCRGVDFKTGFTVPNSVCCPNDPKHAPYDTNTYHAICEAGAHSLTATTATDVASTIMASAAAKAATFLG